MERENSNGNNTKNYSIYVMDILSEGIKEQDLLEKLHGKEDLRSMKIRKDRKGKEGNIAVLSFGTEKSVQAATGEIKAEDHEIKDCKKRSNILLRYTDSRYTNIREMNEKME